MGLTVRFKDVVKIYVRALSLLKNEGWLTALLVVAGVTVSSVQLLEPILFGRVIDALSKQQPTVHVLTLWAGLGVFNIFASVFVAVVSDRLAHRQRLSVMGRAFETALTLPFMFHAEQGSGKVVRAILAGTDHLFGLWLTFMREHLSAIFSVMILIPAALSMDWRLSCLLFALALIYGAGNILILHQTFERQSHVETYHQDLYGRVGDVLGNVTIVQSYTRLLDEIRDFQKIMSQLLQAQYPVLTWWGLLNVVTRISATLTMVMILGFGAILVSRGEVALGQIVTFVGFSGLLISKMDQISAFFYRSITQAATLKTFFDMLDKQEHTTDESGAHDLHHAVGDVEFRDVTFQYPGHKAGVFNLNFRAHPGQTVALVGPTGSGKSTALALLQRMFDPDSGEITIDGVNSKHFTVASLRRNLATVFQESGLFNRSIADNIRVGRPEATDAEVEEAARLAEAHDFIAAKPGGYTFVIGERGSALSGGERQRIAIARAMLKQAPILILDEATSALDNKTERKIQRALERLRQGKTLFVIAHRLSTVMNADQILMFENGRIVEAGNYRNLRASGGSFAQMAEAGELEERQLQ